MRRVVRMSADPVFATRIVLHIQFAIRKSNKHRLVSQDCNNRWWGDIDVMARSTRRRNQSDQGEFDICAVAVISVIIVCSRRGPFVVVRTLQVTALDDFPLAHARGHRPSR